MGASIYGGAVIGSVAVAAGRSLSCGGRISDFFVFIEKNGLQFPDWQKFFAIHPEIMDQNHPRRSFFYSKMITAGAVA
jgi:hypothetical protein